MRLDIALATKPPYQPNERAISGFLPFRRDVSLSVMTLTDDRLQHASFPSLGRVKEGLPVHCKSCR